MGGRAPSQQAGRRRPRPRPSKQPGRQGRDPRRPGEHARQGVNEAGASRSMTQTYPSNLVSSEHRLVAEHDRLRRSALPAGRPGRGGRNPHHQQPLLQADRPHQRGLRLAGAAGRRRSCASRFIAARSRSTSASIASRSPEDYKINVDVLDRYRRQLESLQRRVERRPRPVPLGGPACRCRAWSTTLAATAVDAAADWPVDRAHAAGRAGEPRPDARAKRAGPWPPTWRPIAAPSAASLDQIERRAPLVVEDYRNRLYERLKQDAWPSCKSRSTRPT